MKIREKQAAICLSPGQMRGCLDSQLPDQASTDQTYVVSLSHRDLQERGRSVLHICRACPAWGFEGLGHEALRDLGVESCWIFVLGKGTVVLEACWSGDHPQVIRIRFDGPLSKLVLEDVFKIGFAWWFHHVSPLYVYRIIELYGYV